MACPKCTTRVMVPGNDPPTTTTPFENRRVERSLEALEVPSGGTFAADSFELPSGPGEAVTATSSAPGHLILPRWTMYAVVGLVLATAVASFVAGAWWAQLESKVASP